MPLVEVISYNIVLFKFLFDIFVLYNCKNLSKNSESHSPMILGSMSDNWEEPTQDTSEEVIAGSIMKEIVYIT